jgi:4-oxalocrotonate tautomerase
MRRSCEDRTTYFMPTKVDDMPHVIVKLWPGKSEAQKAELAEAIAQDVIRVLGSREASVSVSFEEVPSEEWAEKVYGPDIAAKPGNLYKKPGYTV